MSSFFRRLQTAYKETNCPSYCWMIPISLAILAINLRAFETIQVDVVKSGGVLDYVVNSLDSPPINGLMAVSGNCSEGYHSLTISSWPGINSEDGANSNEIPMKNWGATHFCVRRIKNYTFTLGDCAEGFRRCHTDLCVDTNESCPITGLKFLRQGEVDKSSASSDSDTISFKDSNYKIQRDYAEYPLVDLEVSYYSQPCLSDTVRPNKPSPAYSKLKTLYGCDPYGVDNLAILLDSETESQLYADNNLEAKLSNIEGYYDTVLGEIVYLALRPRVDLKLLGQCYLNSYSGGGYGPQELISFINNTKMSISGLMGVEAFTVVFCFIAVFLFGCGNTETKESMHNINRLFFMLMLLTEIVLLAVAWYTVGLDSLYLKEVEENLEKIASDDCFYNKNVPVAWSDYKTQIGEKQAGEFAIFIILALSLSAGGVLIKSIGCLWIFIKRR